MSTPRRDFLRHAGLGAAALAALPTLAPAATPQRDWPQRDWPQRDWPRERDDLLAAATDAGDQPPVPQVWDTSWMARVTGKHRAMFDVPEIEGGVGVYRAGIWRAQYLEVFKPEPTEISTVIVIRHSAVPLLMTNEFWTTYEVGKERKLTDEGKPVVYNPVLASPEAKGPGSPYTLDKQMANGAIVLGCNLAFRGVVSLVEKKDGLKGAEARTKALSFLLPGVIMQPSGIFANVAAQEAGCHFVMAV